MSTQAYADLVRGSSLLFLAIFAPRGSHVAAGIETWRRHRWLKTDFGFTSYGLRQRPTIAPAARDQQKAEQRFTKVNSRLVTKQNVTIFR
jgi:hypothetical protein